MKKGFKFTPTTRGDYFDVKRGLEELTRKIKIREAFLGQENKDKSLVRCKSNKTFASKNIDVNNLCRSIEALEPDNIDIDDNLSVAERNALADLKQNRDIVIKPADKGSSIVIMNTEYYRDKLVLGDHLLTDSYKKVNQDRDDTVMEQLKELIDKHSTCLTNKEKEYLIDDEWRTSELYVLPKVHKSATIIEAVSKTNTDVINHITDPPDLKGRPIVAGCSTPTRGLSELISKILKPLVESQKSYVKDDWDVLRKLPRGANGNLKLFGCDITSLYTSIPHELGLEAIKHWVRKRRDLIDDRFSEDFIVDAIELMLQNNNFKFNGGMFTQMIGTAMGHVFAPQYACLVIGYLEEEKLFKEVLPRYFSPAEVKLIEEFYSRYMDDGFTLLPSSIDPRTFLHCLNSLHPSIRFTLEPASFILINGVQAQKLNFLDICIMLLENGMIQTDIHYKPTNSHKYLDYNSFHPVHIKDNIPYGLAKRIICFVSDPVRMEFRLNELRSFLRRCNYPNTVVEKGIFNARLQGPAPKPVDRNDVLPMITTFSSNLDSKPIANNIRALFVSKQHGRLKELLSNLKLVAAYKQPPNLQHQLCSAKFVDSAEELQRPVRIRLPPGLFRNCNTATDKRCKLCLLDYIQPCTSFTCSNGKIWEIRSHINCNTRNVVYFLVCNMCNVETYSGKTWQKIRGRVNDHICKCKSGKGSNKFDKHVHECGIKNGNLKPPYFKVYAFMALGSRDKLITYENYFQRNGYDTLNRSN